MPAARRLADLLAERGDLDGAEQTLRARADAGDWPVPLGLATFRRRWQIDELADLLARQLIKQDRSEEAERLRRFGLNPDGSIACA